MEVFGKRLYSSLCHGGAAVLDHGSQGSFRIPQCTAQYIQLLWISSCVNLGTLQRNKPSPIYSLPRTGNPPSFPPGITSTALLIQISLLSMLPLQRYRMPLTERSVNCLNQIFLFLAQVDPRQLVPQLSSSRQHRLSSRALGSGGGSLRQHVPSLQDSGWWHSPVEGRGAMGRSAGLRPWARTGSGE